MTSEPDPDASPLPDRALRPALELAVGIAAAGAKLRPPLAFPAGLKPFLRFHRLPPTALARVREAVESDSVFLHRLGLVATSDLLDEVGMLWLTRPEGWRSAAAAVVAAAGNGGLDDEARDLRREQRRREAAEAVAMRSRLEVVDLKEQLVAQRAGLELAQVESRRLAAELAASRTQLRKDERSAQKSAKGAQPAQGADATELSALSLQLEAALAARDAALAARDAALVERAAVHGGGSMDVERMRALLMDALALTSGPAPASKRRRRAPLALPGGVYGNSEAAGEHLLRARGAVVLVDGYNVAKLGWPGLALDRQRSVCIDAAENLARRWGSLIHIVFDGASVVGAASPVRRLVRVTFSPEGVSADDVVRAEVAALDAQRPVVVVTNDRAIVADVRVAGANVISSDTFLVLARR